MMFIAPNHNDSLHLSHFKNHENILLNSSLGYGNTKDEINNDPDNIDNIGKKRIRNKFTPEEDQKLRELIKKHGEHSWNVVSSLMENRNQRQCRERWKHYLSCDMKEAAKPWTKEEDSILIKKYNELGAKWTKIALELPGRTDLQVKSRYMKTLKNKRSRRMHDSDETESNDAFLPEDTHEKDDEKSSNEKNDNSNQKEMFHSSDAELIERAFAEIMPQQQADNKKKEEQQEIADINITLMKPNNSDNNNIDNELDFGFDFNAAPSNLITEFIQYNNNNIFNQSFETDMFNWTFE